MLMITLREIALMSENLLGFASQNWQNSKKLSIIVQEHALIIFRNAINANQFHLVGHSLGSHVMVSFKKIVIT